MLLGDEYFCGCYTDSSKPLSEQFIYCSMHDPNKSWSIHLNGNIHYYNLGLINYRYIDGYMEKELHNLFWKMGGIKPERLILRY